MDDSQAKVSSVWASPESNCRAAVILAHGAGSDMNNPFLSLVHEALAQQGFLSIKFNFLYKELGRKAPDPTARLERTYRRVLRTVRQEKGKDLPVFLGGKSMGGRIASHLAAQGAPVHGLVFLGYPLHPPGRTDRLRSEHFGSIPCPLLFIEGTRDPFCRLDLLERAMEKIPVRTDLHIIQDGDHSFNVPKRSGRQQREVWDEIVSVVATWLRKQID